jgi:flagellar biosynthesis protein FlhB
MSSSKLPPSQQKLKKAREDGDVAKSPILNSAVLLTICFCYIYFAANKIILIYSISWANFSQIKSTQDLFTFLHESGKIISGVLLPLFFLLVLFGVLIEVSQVGFVISFKNLSFKGERFNIAKGLSRIFVPAGEEFGGINRSCALVEGLRGVLLILICWSVSAGVVLYLLPQFIAADWNEFSQINYALSYGGLLLVIPLVGILLVLGSVELILARKSRLQRLSMSVDEFRREYRENEGSPEAKSHRKQFHFELLHNAMVQGVRKAKVVILGRE